MTQPNAWGVAPAAPKAWADEVEAEEEKHGAVLAPLKKDDDDAFPSLGAAVKVKENKREKKKKQTMSLTEFMKGGTSSRPSDDDILMSLPTKPRERAPGEAPPERGLGGGFGRDYGGRGGGGGFGRRGDDDDRPPRREREEDMGPSRAEMSDNWGRDRKFEPTGDRDRGRGFGGGGSFRDRDFGDRDRDRGGFGDRERRMDDGPSRADAEDRWGAGRQFVPSEDRGSRDRGGFGDRDRDRGGFGDRDRDRGYGPPRDSFREPSRADTEDRWERKGDFQPTAFEDRAPRGERMDDRPRSRGFGETWGGARDGSRDPPRSFSDRDDGGREASQDRWGRRDDAAAPPAAAGGEGPRERPKLNLAPRSASVDKPEGASAAGAAKPNPFGAARPREEVLKEQGRDYRKEELQLEHKAAEVLREETEEERALSSEIESLRVKVEAGEADALLDPSEGSEGRTVQQALDEAEERLAKLQLELDDKVRYSRRQAGGEGREGPRRDDERGGSSWSRGPPREYSRERGDAPRRMDSRDRRPDDREGGRGFEDRDRRDYGGRSFRDSSRDAAPARGGSRW